MERLSVFIITKNEEKNLPGCFDAIGDLADEIVVLDSGSTDKTEEIAKSKGAKFSFRKFDGFGQQKYAAEQLCTHDWVLNLDADEYLTDAIKFEIQSFLSSDKTKHYDGAKMKIISVYPHHTKPRPFADYHHYIRLYNKRALNFPQHPTHDNIDLKNEDRIYHFKSIVHHHAFESIEALEAKARARTIFYFKQEKQGLYLKNLIRLPFEFFFSFFKAYILRRHITGGWYGIRNAYIYAKYRFIRILQRVLKRRILKD